LKSFLVNCVFRFGCRQKDMKVKGYSLAIENSVTYSVVFLLVYSIFCCSNNYI